MAYQKNIKINQNNIVQISGSLITLTGSVSGSQISGSRLQSTIVSASNLFAGGILYPTADGDAGQVMVTDGLGTLTFQDPVANDLIIRVKNREVTTILKGTPCYITSSGTSGNIAGILRADANNPARMPAACIAFEDILADTEGLAILEGFINGVNTNGFASGEAVYVAVGGGYTNIRPTGSALVQPLGYIEKVGTNGSGVVKGPGHHYIVPNITANHIWVGGANGVPVELNKEVFATTGSNTFIGSQIISGNLTVTGTISGTVGQFTSLTASTSNITTLTSSNALFLNNIQVNGTASIAQLNTVNQQSLFVGDKYITILSGAADHANLDGSGILWGSGAFAEPTQNELGSHAHVRYRLSNDTLEIFPGLTVGSGSNFVLITSSSISASQYINVAAGAANQIQFNSGVNNTLAADSTFVWTGAQRLGIGTATPTSKLQVVGGDAVINSIRVGLGNGSQSSNLVVGASSLGSNTAGALNTAIGANTLQNNQSGSNNTAVGYGTLQTLNTSTNGGNTAVGSLALNVNQAADNTAVGKSALSANISGSQNVAIGANSIAFSTSSFSNVAIGYNTLRFNNSTQNVAIGWSAGAELASPTSTAGNVFVGYNAANTLLTGSGNVFLGSQAGTGLTNISNTFILALGTTERIRVNNSGNVGIGTTNPGERLEVNGNTILSGTLAVSGNISSINGVTYSFPSSQGVTGSVLANNGAGTLSWTTSILSASTVTVTNDSTTNATRNLMFASTASGPSSILADSDFTYNPSTNTLTVGTLVESSSRIFKTEIQSITNQLEKVVKLNPVSYVRKKDNKQELGLIAEEVKEIYPEFVVGEGINYPKMVSILVSAVKELSEKVEKQSVEIDLLKNKKKTTRGKK